MYCICIQVYFRPLTELQLLILLWHAKLTFRDIVVFYWVIHKWHNPNFQIFFKRSPLIVSQVLPFLLPLPLLIDVIFERLIRILCIHLLRHQKYICHLVSTVIALYNCIFWQKLAILLKYLLKIIDLNCTTIFCWP